MAQTSDAAEIPQPSEAAAAAAVAGEQPRIKDPVMASSIIGAHGLEHMYGHGLMALLPAIYTTLGLSAVQIAMIPAVRQLASGATSVVGGFVVDMFQHRRGLILAMSMLMLGTGYLLVATLPTYGLMLAALVIASAGSAIWHPAALGLLAQRYPHRRGLLISLHRSTGNIGDSVGPFLVGVLLLLLGDAAWRWIAGGGTPLLFLLGLIILLFLWNVGGPKVHIEPAGGQQGGHGHGLHAHGSGPPNRLQAQWASLKEAMKGGGVKAIMPIFLVSAVRGMGDRTVVWILPLYITQSAAEGGLGLGPLVMGIHVALLTAPGIVSGPVFGALSDRMGRKPLIVFLMAVAVVLPIGIVLGGATLWMTLAVALFGLFHYSVNSLTQAAAIDVVEGRQLEGTFIGLMWGSNAAFGAASAIIAGWLVSGYGWGVAFYFASALFFVGLLASFLIPRTGRPALHRA
jgi:MFS transporter, FSR family, fosmidomycin resistance protein